MQISYRGCDTEPVAGTDALGAAEHRPQEEVWSHVALDETVNRGKTSGETF
jgi:hypothetical protein